MRYRFAALIVATSPFLLLALLFCRANSGQPFLPTGVASSEQAYAAGMAAYQAGDWQAAAEHLRRVPKSHPDYGRAMRFLGYNVLTRQLGRPKEGLRYVNAAVLADPLEGNVWQDLYRIYLRGAGVTR